MGKKTKSSLTNDIVLIDKPSVFPVTPGSTTAASDVIHYVERVREKFRKKASHDVSEAKRRRFAFQPLETIYNNNQCFDHLAQEAVRELHHDLTNSIEENESSSHDIVASDIRHKKHSGKRKSSDQKKKESDITEERRHDDSHSESVIIKEERSEPEQSKGHRASQIVEDVQAMVSILKSELQAPYDPRAGTDKLVNGIRTRQDHIGRHMKRGTYTKEEHMILKTALDDYFKMNGWDEQEGWENISAFGEGSGKQIKTKEVASKRHWEQIAIVLPQRSVRSVLLYAHRQLHPWKNGAWSPDEEQELVDLVLRYGFEWTRFAYEHFNRSPNCILNKWKVIEPRVNQQLPIRRLTKHYWSKDDDTELLTNVRLVTGVTLPYRAIPWAEVKRLMPQFTTYQLSWRYKNTLFPLILSGKYKGARGKVLFRQFLRYVRRGIEAGVLKDLSEVETQRIVPFWYCAGHIRRVMYYLKTNCPIDVQQASFKEQIEFMYKLEKCDKKERHDLRRLARSFRALQEINGIVLLPQSKGLLSERFKNPMDNSIDSSQLSQNKSNSTLMDNILDQEKRDVINETSLNEVSQSETFSELLFKKVEGLTIPPSILKRPLTATIEKINEVVPDHMQHVPEAFPIYLETMHRKKDKQQYYNEQKEQEKKAVSLGQNKENHVDYLDYHLYSSLGLVNDHGQFKNFDHSISSASTNVSTHAKSIDSNNIMDTTVSQIHTTEKKNIQDYLEAVQHINSLADEQSSSDATSDNENSDDNDFLSQSQQSIKKKKTSSIVRKGGLKLSKKSHPWLS